MCGCSPMAGPRRETRGHRWPCRRKFDSHRSCSSQEDCAQPERRPESSARGSLQAVPGMYARTCRGPKSVDKGAPVRGERSRHHANATTKMLGRSLPAAAEACNIDKIQKMRKLLISKIAARQRACRTCSTSSIGWTVYYNFSIFCSTPLYRTAKCNTEIARFVLQKWNRYRGGF
jgi:hypothetical protein